MTVSFTVMGKPEGKGRPRFANTKFGVKTYTPQETLVYENMVSWTYQQKCKVKLEGTIGASIKAYFPIPKSTSKKKRELMEKEGVLYDHKPDSDNIAKVILDSINGIAYDDDKQVAILTVQKYYSKTPRVDVYLWEVSNGN